MTSIAAPIPSLYPIEKLPEGWATVEVTFVKDGKEIPRRQIIDMRADPYMQYRHEPMYLISLKCAELVIGIPFYLAGNLLFRAGRTVVLMAGTILRSSYNLLSEQTVQNLIQWGSDLAFEVPATLLQGIQGVARSCYYALEMTLSAFYGIFCPLEGRVLVANAERGWSGSTRSHDKTRFTSEEFFKEIFTDRHSKKTHFMAYCFQPVGPLNALNIKSWKIVNPSSQ